MKILIAKPGLDGHDRGAKVVAHALRDAGVEVVYSGLKRAPEEIVAEAIQEGVVVGGIIPPCDVDELKKLGVSGVFPTGTPLADVVAAFTTPRESLGADRK